MIHTLFTTEDADRAYDEWGANCGPVAIAAICGLTLLRPHMGDFEAKKYTSPTLMWEVLKRLGVRWCFVPHSWPHHGFARVQWEGGEGEGGLGWRRACRLLLGIDTRIGSVPTRSTQ